MTSLKTSLSELVAAFPATVLESERAFGEGGTTYLDGDNVLVAIEASISSRLDKEEMTEVVDSYWREGIYKCDRM